MSELAPDLGCRPLIILGAGRSGTNMLRDALTQFPGMGTWPCDEINPIWRHGNTAMETDEFGPEQARPEIRRFIRRRFRSLARSSQNEWVVEKTCANSLRPLFVHAVLPEARFIHIVRDGRDVALSAAKRWTGKTTFGYIARKARWVPIRDLPRYGWRFLQARLHKLRSGESRLSSWGPRYAGLEHDFSSCDLVPACARQWARCVQRCREGLSTLPEEQVLEVQYEDFVQNPIQGMRRIEQFLGLNWTEEDLRQSVAAVSPKSVGNWKRALSEAHRSQIESEHASLLGLSPGADA